MADRAVVGRRGDAHEIDAGDGRTIAVHATAAETGGRLGVVDFLHPPNERITPHLHARSDEWFYVVEGRCSFSIADEQHDAPTGTFVYVPKGVVHDYTAGEDGARVLFGFVPAGPEKFFPAMVALRARPDATPQDGEALTIAHDILPPEQFRA